MCYNINKENLEEFMMDWNGDGKYDRQDEDYFYNFVEEDKKNNGTNSNNEHYSNSSSSNIFGTIVLIVCVVYVLIKLIF